MPVALLLGRNNDKADKLN